MLSKLWGRLLKLRLAEGLGVCWQHALLLHAIVCTHAGCGLAQQGEGHNIAYTNFACAWHKLVVTSEGTIVLVYLRNCNWHGCKKSWWWVLATRVRRPCSTWDQHRCHPWVNF